MSSLNMKSQVYRILLVTAIVALTGLITIQVRWFVQAYKVTQKQFDESVNVALRSVADKLRDQQEDYTSRIPAIEHLSSGTYLVKARVFISFNHIDSVLRAEFKRNHVDAPFVLEIFEAAHDSLVLGNYYDKGVLSGTASCMGRGQKAQLMNFSISFPEKGNTILDAMDFWFYSALGFLIILSIFIYVVIDLSKQKKLAVMKTDFVNNITHELQTPITNISMASEVLRAATQSLDQKKIQQYADIIFEENQRLKFHTEQVLQTAQLEKGELILNKKLVNIHDMLQDVIAKFQRRIDTKRGELIYSLQAQSAAVVGDYYHLSNLFYNLLDNADKYSNETPQITVVTHNTGHGIMVTVSDKGIGMKEDDQRLIFDKFYRVSSGNQHEVKGFGLGLTYVQQIVKAHAGFVHVTSEEKKGSNFQVWLKNVHVA
jgi:two-component system phosphate regulon sensor histidine kinase PhoR